VYADSAQSTPLALQPKCAKWKLKMDFADNGSAIITHYKKDGWLLIRHVLKAMSKKYQNIPIILKSNN